MKLTAVDRRVSLLKAELGEYLCSKTFLIDLAGHSQVEDYRCDTLPRPTSFMGGETKLSANGIKGPEHCLKVMRLEAAGTQAAIGHGALADPRRDRSFAPFISTAMQPGTASRSGPDGAEACTAPELEKHQSSLSTS